RGDPVRAEQHSNLALRKIAHDLFNDRQYRISAVSHAEDYLVFGVVLPAEAGEIVVSIGVEPTHRLQDACRWCKARGGWILFRGDAEKAPCAVNGDQI